MHKKLRKRLTNAMAIMVAAAMGMALAVLPGLDGSTKASAATDSSASASQSASYSSSPSVLYSEDFENGTTQSYPPTELNNYVSKSTAASGSSIKYSASSYWLNAGYCNGFVTSANIPVNQDQIDRIYCGRNTGSASGDYDAVRVKAYVLGALSGGKFDLNNHALSTNTSGGIPDTDINSPDSIMFQTDPNTPITLPSSTKGRFIAFSVDAANTYCDNPDHPKMQFQYTQNGEVKALPLGSNATIDPCTAKGSTSFDVSGTSAFSADPSWVTKGSYGTFYSGSFLLNDSSPIGLILRNISPASSTGAGIGNKPASVSGYSHGEENGNDGAIDNIEIKDVTPYLTKSFDPGVQSVGLTSTMTLTVNNRTDMGEKKGWGFTETLPSGLEFANSTVGGTCGGSKVVDMDKGTLTVSDGDLSASQASCTITTTVTSIRAATYTNGQPHGNFSNTIGIDGPNDATVEFYDGTASWQKVDESDNTKLLSGSVWKLDGPTPSTTSTPASGWPTGTVTDCVADSADKCTGLDKDPAAGKFTVTGLPSGTYTLTETTPPSGYIPGDGPWTATISADNRDVSFGTGGQIGNSLGSAVWSKQDASTSALLQESQWDLTRTGSGGQTYHVTDCVGADASACVGLVDQNPAAGKFSVRNLPTGTYMLTETKAPEGYSLITEPVGPLEIKQGQATIDFGAISDTRLTGSVSWTKVTANSGSGSQNTRLSGSQWSLVGPGVPEGTVVTDCTSAPCPAGSFKDHNAGAGEFSLTGLGWGTYTLTESKAPAGYELDSTPHSFTISADHITWIFSDPFTNRQKTPPALPLTGGMSADVYLVIGSTLVILAITIGAALRRTRGSHAC